MRCVICEATIGSREPRSYVHVYRNGKPRRKLYACSVCSESHEAFDRLIDALPVDEDGNLLDVTRAEIEALILATDRKRLEKRLREARSVLRADVRRRFGHALILQTAA